MQSEPMRLGRYTLHAELASGGMASVYLGRLAGDAGFSRIVAVKRMHRHLTDDESLVSMFVDEARLAARIVHPNVVQTLDVVSADGELFLVMEFVQGETLANLAKLLHRRNDPRFPVPIASAIVVGALMGLHAAHTATDASGAPLGIVHRDVSPQNVMVGVDGVPRVLDFGVAKARVRLQTTQEGQVKGKLAYMAPEQLTGEVTQRTDVYAAGILLWELLTGERLFPAETEMQLLDRVLHATIARPGDSSPHVSGALDAVVMQALSREPLGRFGTALEMARALEAAARPASNTEVAAWLARVAGDRLAKRRAKVAEVERGAAPPLDRAQMGGYGGLPKMGVSDSSQDVQSVGAHTLPDPPSNFSWSIPASVAALAVGATAAVLVYWTHQPAAPTSAAQPSGAVESRVAGDAAPKSVEAGRREVDASPSASVAAPPSAEAAAPATPASSNTVSAASSAATPQRAAARTGASPPKERAKPRRTDSTDLGSLIDSRR